MGTLAQWTDGLLKLPGPHWLSERTMTRYGIRNLMRFAKTYNQWRYRRRARRHQQAFDTEFDALLREHGGAVTSPPRVVMEDGWAIDTSQSLPGLGRLLDEAGEVVRERGGKKHSDVQQP